MASSLVSSALESANNANAAESKTDADVDATLCVRAMFILRAKSFGFVLHGPGPLRNSVNSYVLSALPHVTPITAGPDVSVLPSNRISDAKALETNATLVTVNALCYSGDAWVCALDVAGNPIPCSWLHSTNPWLCTPSVNRYWVKMEDILNAPLLASDATAVTGAPATPSGAATVASTTPGLLAAAHTL